MPGIRYNGEDIYPGGNELVKESLAGLGGAQRQGVFAQHPAATPKYHTGNTEGSLQYMARLFVPLSEKELDDFVGAFPEGPTRDFAYVLAMRPPGRGVFATSGTGYIDFLLQQVQENYQEKYEAVDVLSDNYVSYFYGQQPPIFQYAGTLLNSYQDDWRAAFTVIYQSILRGTKMARFKKVVTLAYDDVMVSGVLTNLSQTLTADLELAAPFTFQMLVKRYDNYTLHGGPYCPPTMTEAPNALSLAVPGLASPLVKKTVVTNYRGKVAVFTTTQGPQKDVTKTETPAVTPSFVASDTKRNAVGPKNEEDKQKLDNPSPTPPAQQTQERISPALLGEDHI